MLFHPFAGFASRLPLAELAWFHDVPRALAQADIHMDRLRARYPHVTFRFKRVGVQPRHALPETAGKTVWIILATIPRKHAKAAVRRERVPKPYVEWRGRLKLIPDRLVPVDPFVREFTGKKRDW